MGSKAPVGELRGDSITWMELGHGSLPHLDRVLHGLEVRKCQTPGRIGLVTVGLDVLQESVGIGLCFNGDSALAQEVCSAFFAQGAGRLG